MFTCFDPENRIFKSHLAIRLTFYKINAHIYTEASAGVQLVPRMILWQVPIFLRNQGYENSQLCYYKQPSVSTDTHSDKCSNYYACCFFHPAATFSCSLTPKANGPSSMIVERRTSRAVISFVYRLARCIDCLSGNPSDRFQGQQSRTPKGGGRKEVIPVIPPHHISAIQPLETKHILHRSYNQHHLYQYLLYASPCHLNRAETTEEAGQNGSIPLAVYNAQSTPKSASGSPPTSFQEPTSRAQLDTVLSSRQDRLVPGGGRRVVWLLVRRLWVCGRLLGSRVCGNARGWGAERSVSRWLWNDAMGEGSDIMGG